MKKGFLKRLVGAITAVSMMASAAASLSVFAAPSKPDLPGDYLEKKVVGYFPNYAMKDDVHQNFNITQLQWEQLTHVQYAFGTVDEDTLELVPSEPETDVESKFPGQTFTHKGMEIKIDESLAYYGQYNLMHTMRKLYPDVTVLLSVGGWAASRNIWFITDSEANMRKFAASAIDYMRTYGFDGIDMDFEYPSSTVGCGDPLSLDVADERRDGISDRYTQFMQIMREEFDKAALADGTYYWLTAAVADSNWVNGGVINADWLDYLDFVSIMSYDLGGGWTFKVENQANIYTDPANTDDGYSLSFEWGMDYYRGKVPSEKLLMGVPYYTRGWNNVTKAEGAKTGLHGTSAKPGTENDTATSWDGSIVPSPTPDPLTGNLNIWHDKDENGNEVAAGVNPLWHVMNVMKNDPTYKVYQDPVGGVPHIWNETKKQFLTFENKTSIQNRIDCVKENNLGGVLIWVMHGDYDYNGKTGEYEIGDTLTSMFNEQFKKQGTAKQTSDIDVHAETADFTVKVEKTGSWAVNNVHVTNNTGEDLTDYTFSFDLSKSAYVPDYEAVTITDSTIDRFKTITFTVPEDAEAESRVFKNGETKTFACTIVYNFSDLKNFKLNGKLSTAEVQEEKDRIARMAQTGTQAKTFTVTLVPQNGSAKQTFVYREGAPFPAKTVAPAKAPTDCAFDGWYTDAEATKPYDGKALSAATTLYAAWKNAVVKTESTELASVTKENLAKLESMILRHDTMKDKTVQVRIEIQNPAALTDDVHVSGYVEGKEVDSAIKRLNKWFQNDAVAISFDQAGKWGQSVQVAAKVNLEGFNTETLHFYAYDAESNRYIALKNPEYKLDKSGYLHFSTNYAGTIVITDSALVKAGV